MSDETRKAPDTDAEDSAEIPEESLEKVAGGSGNPMNDPNWRGAYHGRVRPRGS